MEANETKQERLYALSANFPDELPATVTDEDMARDVHRSVFTIRRLRRKDPKFPKPIRLSESGPVLTPRDEWVAYLGSLREEKPAARLLESAARMRQRKEARKLVADQQPIKRERLRLKRPRRR